LTSHTAPEPEDVLKELVDIYNHRVARNTYEPIQQIQATAMLADQPPMAALVAKVLAIEAKLSQDRSASQKNQERRCYNCGQPGHVKPDCPKLRAEDATSSNPTAGLHRSGLDFETAKKCFEIAKTRIVELGDPKLIPLEARHDIIVDGQIVVKYCNHCRRFVKGRSAHYTTEHVGPLPGTKPSTAPRTKPYSAAPPSNPVLHSPTNPPSQLTAAVASLPGAPPIITHSSLSRCEIPDYDTPPSPSLHSVDRAPSDYNAFYTCIDNADPFDNEMVTDYLQEPMVPLADVPQYQEPPHFSPSEWDTSCTQKRAAGSKVNCLPCADRVLMDSHSLLPPAPIGHPHQAIPTFETSRLSSSAHTRSVLGRFLHVDSPYA